MKPVKGNTIRTITNRCLTPRRKRQALTAIELLVAAALSSLLIVAILGLTRTLHVQCRELMSSARSEPWQQLLCEQLRRDLANTRFMTYSQNRLVLAGYLGTRGSELHSTLRAAEVTYYITRGGDVPCLLRSERSLTSVTNVTQSQRLLAVGVDRMEIVNPGVLGDVSEYSGTVPHNFQLLVYGNGDAQPLAEVSWSQ